MLQVSVLVSTEGFLLVSQARSLLRNLMYLPHHSPRAFDLGGGEDSGEKA